MRDFVAPEPLPADEARLGSPGIVVYCRLHPIAQRQAVALAQVHPADVEWLELDHRTPFVSHDGSVTVRCPQHGPAVLSPLHVAHAAGRVRRRIRSVVMWANPIGPHHH